MNKITLIILLFIVLAIFSTSCDENSVDNSTTGNFKVKFINEKFSAFSIFSIELQAMGPAPGNNPNGAWSDNLLKNGKILKPGDFEFLFPDIPSGHWSQYRLGAIDSNGNRVFLEQQDNYFPEWKLPITHWGADTRTVSVTLAWDRDNKHIIVSGWSDFAGIEE